MCVPSARGNIELLKGEPVDASFTGIRALLPEVFSTLNGTTKHTHSSEGSSLTSNSCCVTSLTMRLSQYLLGSGFLLSLCSVAELKSSELGIKLRLAGSSELEFQMLEALLQDEWS